MSLVRTVLVGGEVIQAHSEEDCDSQPCCIHSPSDHHMRNWPQHWRGDRKLMERLCRHGIGHPDPDDGEVLAGRDLGIHGCDGCCTPPIDHEAENKRLREAVRWMAQTIHQAYHEKGTFETCSKNTCSHAAQVLGGKL